MILTKTEALYADECTAMMVKVNAVVAIHFNNHPKGRIEVKSALGGGVIVECYSGRISTMCNAREHYPTVLDFRNAYNI